MRMGSKKSVFVCHASENTTLYNSKVTNSTHPHKGKKNKNKKRNQLSLVTARKDSENTKVYQKIREDKRRWKRKKGDRVHRNYTKPIPLKMKLVFCLFIAAVLKRGGK